MNERNSISVMADRRTMTSVEIAEVTGKQHKNVMQAIRNMEPAWEKVNGLKFQLVDYTDKKGEKRPMYALTKTECLYVATKFNDEARARLVLRWEQLERAATEDATATVTAPAAYVTMPRQALSRRELLLLALDAEEECGRLREENESLRLRLMNPEATYTVTEIARMQGVDAHTLNGALEEIGLQSYHGGMWHISPRLEGCGFTAVKHTTVLRSDGRREYRPYMVWTESGYQFLNRIITGAKTLPADRKGGAL